MDVVAQERLSERKSLSRNRTIMVAMTALGVVRDTRQRYTIYNFDFQKVGQGHEV